MRKRLPAQSPQTLDRFKLFIFPSAAGAGFLVVTLLLWLVGTNYENNLVIGLAFLLTSLFVVSILHTFGNLSGVTLRALDSVPAFVGEDAEVTLLVSAEGGRQYENILLGWPDGSTVAANLLDSRETRCKLFVPTRERGWMDPGRLLVETYYPLGLMRCWTWLDLDIRVLVYPRPIYGGKVPPAEAVADDGSLAADHGSEDFNGLKAYRPGESLRHIAWKHYARGQGLHTKDFTALVDQRLWLDWEFFDRFDKEGRLSRLCYWVLEISKTQNEYGLRLPGVEIRPGKGLEHKQQVLKALALFAPPARAARQVAA
ncbi:DUF58 domain-containing protein [Exilibacterium tricleocarpae]|uniref:DUF58 domain-containing protein n=1 Tax=Exilibacterium tricleocarpae TaxID=2591008 RepID=A0A545SRW4_9GAMM|nr:DUF58 domain-containing protein [Exilibacterium tricleocarpae]